MEPEAPVPAGVEGAADVEEHIPGALLGVGGAPALGPGPLGVAVPGAVPIMEPVAPAHAGIESTAAVDEHIPGALLGVGGTCTVKVGAPGAGRPTAHGGIPAWSRRHGCP